MTQCSLRVIANGYVLAYMDGNDMIELCFDDRDDLFEYLQQNLPTAIWEETE